MSNRPLLRTGPSHRRVIRGKIEVEMFRSWPATGRMAAAIDKSVGQTGLLVYSSPGGEGQVEAADARSWPSAVSCAVWLQT
jgi:hypothetical protein